MAQHENSWRSMLIFIFVTAAMFFMNSEAIAQPDYLEESITLIQENMLLEARPLLEQVVEKHSEDSDAHAWLAEVYRRLGMKGDAVRTAQRALDLGKCSSFAHTVIADASRRLPGDEGLCDTDTTWVHLQEAVKCDSTDGNAWVSIWNDAILREKFDVMHKAVLKMEETGFLTGAALAYGKWMMRTLPQDAILITNGDMDTFPLLVLQAVENFRPDIVVAERGLLGTTQFLRHIRDDRSVSLPFGEAQLDSLARSDDPGRQIHARSGMIFKGWVDMKAKGTFDRPIAIAVTVTEDYYADFKDNLLYEGPFLSWQPGPVGDTKAMASLEESLAGVLNEDFTGPWVSDQDRSPVRRVYTKGLVFNVTCAALSYADALIEMEHYADALRTLDWAERFERTTELGPALIDEIAELRDAVKKRKQ